MGRLKIGSCPRCKKGEVFIDRDHYGWYQCCLQCGNMRDLPDMVNPEFSAGESAAKTAVTVKQPGRKL